MFAMLFTVGTSYFIFVANANASNNTSLLNRSANLQAALNENLLVTALLSSGHIAFYVNVTGGLNVNITSALVLDTSSSVLKCDGVGLPVSAGCSNSTPPLWIVVNAGKGSAKIDTGYLYVPGTTDTVEIITQRGNAYSANYPPSQNVLAALSLSSGAFGDLYMNRNSYTDYQICTLAFLACTPCTSGTCYIQKVGAAFSIPAATATGGPLAIALSITNLNPNKLNITLDQYTLINHVVVARGAASNFKAVSWFIVSNSSTQILSSYSKITLLYNVPTVLLFASNTPGTFQGFTISSSIFSAGTETLVSILTHGCRALQASSCTNANANYGQNSPYVSTLYY